jgi:hypothetical protein
MERASEEEQETDEEKIERLAQEIEKLRSIFKEVNFDEEPGRWVKLCAAIENKDIERILLAGKLRCNAPVSECILCFEKQRDPTTRTMIRYICCGEQEEICRECSERGSASLATLKFCPLCNRTTKILKLTINSAP